MARIKHSVAKHKGRKRLLKQAKGYFLDRSKQYRQAKKTVDRALVYKYRDRKNKKRVFRALWITRLNAACREAGMTYSSVMDMLKKADIMLDRKILAELAVSYPAVFAKVLELAGTAAKK